MSYNFNLRMTSRFHLWFQIARETELVKQKGNLRSQEHCFCIGGVLCEAYRIAAKQGHWKRNEDNLAGFDFVLNGNNSYCFIPARVSLWIHGDDAYNKFKEVSRIVKLGMRLNDETNLTLHQIANVLEGIIKGTCQLNEEFFRNV